MYIIVYISKNHVYIELCVSSLYVSVLSISALDE